MDLKKSLRNFLTGGGPTHFKSIIRQLLIKERAGGQGRGVRQEGGVWAWILDLLQMSWAILEVPAAVSCLQCEAVEKNQ